MGVAIIAVSFVVVCIIAVKVCTRRPTGAPEWLETTMPPVEVNASVDIGMIWCGNTSIVAIWNVVLCFVTDLVTTNTLSISVSTSMTLVRQHIWHIGLCHILTLTD